ncbi:MAG: hypothetical protein HXY34_06715 [Candidatus Thorarchaeota archaeon]|nr:hypothetical protein [Candidatus Thorarchaeota archaeon]
MDSDRIKWLLKDKIVCDFRGFPIGRVKKLWYDTAEGPLVIVERNHDASKIASWEAIPLRAVDTVRDEVRLKPPVFAE